MYNVHAKNDANGIAAAVVIPNVILRYWLYPTGSINQFTLILIEM